MAKAYVFPGQGAQFVGMGKDLYESNPKAKELSSRPLTLLCSSFGLGLTWGTMLLRTQIIKVLPINKM